MDSQSRSYLGKGFIINHAYCDSVRRQFYAVTRLIYFESIMKHLFLCYESTFVHKGEKNDQAENNCEYMPRH